MSTPTPIQYGQKETDSPDKRGSIIKTLYDTQWQWDMCRMYCVGEWNKILFGGFYIWDDDRWKKECANACMAKNRQESQRQGSHPDMMY